MSKSTDRLLRVVRGVAVLAVTLLLVAGCGSSPSSSGQQSSSKTFEVTTPDGQVSVSLDGKLPPNWPSDFPIPAGADVAGSGSLGGSASTAMVAVYTTSKAAPETFEYYKSNPDVSSTSARSVGTGNHFVGRLQVTAPHNGSVTVVDRSGKTYIIVVLKSPRATPSS